MEKIFVHFFLRDNFT